VGLQILAGGRPLAAKKSAKTQITLDQLLELRQLTEKLSGLLKEQLGDYLATLRPLIAPRRVLGRYAGAVGSIAREDQAFEELGKQYDAICGRFRLSSGLEKGDLSSVDADLELYPWEYTHDAIVDGQTHPVTVTSPVRWVLTYQSEYTLKHMREVIAGKAERRPHAVQNFVIHALAMNLVLSRNAGVSRILKDLRFDLSTEFSSDFGKLPLTTLHAPLHSFLPDDKVVLSSTRFSGVPEFIELIDTESIETLGDPLQAKLREIAGS
jgi:hypothetical protein